MIYKHYLFSQSKDGRTEVREKLIPWERTKEIFSVGEFQRQQQPALTFFTSRRMSREWEVHFRNLPHVDSVLFNEETEEEYKHLLTFPDKQAVLDGVMKLRYKVELTEEVKGGIALPALRFYSKDEIVPDEQVSIHNIFRLVSYAFNTPIRPTPQYQRTFLSDGERRAEVNMDFKHILTFETPEGREAAFKTLTESGHTVYRKEDKKILVQTVVRVSEETQKSIIDCFKPVEMQFNQEAM
jgi:hypothetical protein